MPMPAVATSPITSAMPPKKQFHTQRSAERKSLCTDIVFFGFRQGPFGRAELTPGPDDVGIEKIIWSRSPDGADTRTFQLPCSGDALANRDGAHDTKPPFTCGTYARRSVIKYFLRNNQGGMGNNSKAKEDVIKAVKKLINETRAAWTNDDNYMCKCKNGTVGWGCCAEQKDCATEPCPCDSTYDVKYSVACCTSVCTGLAAGGLMKPFSYLPGSALTKSLLTDLATYLSGIIWTSTDPWLRYDPTGYDVYRKSWLAAGYTLADMALFDTTDGVLFYDEATHPMNTTFWDHCAGLLGQVMWTMPLDRKTGRPRYVAAEFDPIEGESMTPNMTYREEFIQKLILESYKQSPTYWHYHPRYSPSDSAMCQRQSANMPGTGSFPLSGTSTYSIPQFGFSSMTLGGLGGTDCYCGWWNTATSCKIPDALCSRMVQMIGFNRVCLDQNRIYNSTDHFAVLDAIDLLRTKDPSVTYSCPSLQVSDHWGFNATLSGQLFANATDTVLKDGVAGIRVGNVDWLMLSQAQIVNPRTRARRMERNKQAKASINCNPPLATTSIADHFIDEMFPAAQGVRQSAPQSYCVRYGIELARLTVYKASGLAFAIGQQQATVDKWKLRCQFKLRQVAVCKKHQILNATGPPTDTTNCPFSLVVATTHSYAVTPACLVILWEKATGRSAIYDPCLCNACFLVTGRVQIAAPFASGCLVQNDALSLVADDVIVGENPDSVDLPLGRGSFPELLMTKPDRLKVNAPYTDFTHWAAKVSILHSDLLLDWWPDEWEQPVGHHVTPSCSIYGDQHWKTFDSAWRWDPVSEKMIYAPELADPLLSRNAFGAGGFCRTHNYGMPMTTLNTMRVCTMENANAQADPLVAAPSSERAWADGQERCSDSPFKTPWNFSTFTNTPNQWSVGTLQQGPLDLYYTTEWGDGCGPYPLRTCSVDGDCATGLKCVRSRSSTGVCGSLAPGLFECTQHSQCGAYGDKLCAGDGRCVDGVWHVVNNLQESVTFRTHSQTCSTGDKLDTWGTSSAETVPDILNASGLCSYRSWLENRRMSKLNQCENSNTCPNFQGVYPWNFSSPRISGQSDAFSDDVLKVRPHPCDRDYQHYEGFSSCTPGDNYIGMRYTDTGVPIYIWARGNRTQTYRPSNVKQLPLMHHVENAAGPTVGFVGVDGKSYSDLGLGANPTIMSCSSMQVCGFQNEFRVNNFIVPSGLRKVLVNGVPRTYSMMDLTKCGVYGYWDGSLCHTDFAIAPFAHLYLNVYNTAWKNHQAFLAIKTNLQAETYLASDKQARLDVLNALPEAIITAFVGGRPTTFQDYITGSQKFSDLFSQIRGINMPVYEEAGAPSQIYFLTLYGAYEVPFAWWCKCSWLGGWPMGKDPIDSSTCGWHMPNGTLGQSTVFGAFDDRLSSLFGISPATRVMTPTTTKTLLKLLVQLPGIVTQTLLDNALADYRARRNAWMARLADKARDKVFIKCFQRKDYVYNYSRRSERYQLQRVQQFAGQSNGFDTTAKYLDDTTNETLCYQDACFQSMDPALPITSYADFSQLLLDALTTQSPVTSNAGAISLGSTDAPDDDLVTLANVFSVAGTSQTVWDGVAGQFGNIPGGCTRLVYATKLNQLSSQCLCTAWGDCSPTIKQAMLKMGDVADTPTPGTAPNVVFKNAQNEIVETLDACAGTGNGSIRCATGRCLVEERALDTATDITLPPGVQAELYSEISWRCALLNCVETNLANNTYVPAGYTTTVYDEEEIVEIKDYNFSQTFRKITDNQWTDASEAYERSQFEREQLGPHCYDADIFSSTANANFGTWEEYMEGGETLRYGKHSIYYDYQLRQASKGPNNELGFELRSVSRSAQDVLLKGKEVNYYANGVLNASILMFPCGFSDDFLTAYWNDLAGATTGYRKLKDVAGHKCSTIGKTSRPGVADFFPGYIRTVDPVPSDGTLATSVEITRVMNRIRKILGDIETHLTPSQDSLLVSRQQNVVVDTDTQGSVSITPWTTADTEDKCKAIRDDSIFGCSMYPGEDTMMNSEYKCLFALNGVASINAAASNRAYDCDKWAIYDAIASHCGDHYKKTYGHPSYPVCVSGADPCKGGLGRDFKLRGRTITYTYNSKRRACSFGPEKDCFLPDELQRIRTDTSAACFGESGDPTALKRRAAYSNALTRGLRTGIQLLTTVIESKTDLPLFNHVYFGLKSGYVCGSCVSGGTQCDAMCSDPVPTCGLNKVAVEVRTNLYACLGCPLVSTSYCTGQHNCQMQSPAFRADDLNYMVGWSNLSSVVRDYLVGTSVSAPIDIAIAGFKWLSAQVLSLSMPSVGLSYDLPAFMTSYDRSGEQYSYSPLAIVAYSKSMETAVLKCTSTALMPDFTACNYDGRRKNLRSFVRANYKVPDGLIIEKGVTLLWKMLRSQMVSQNIPAWESYNNKSGMFLSDLFDDKWCKKGVMSDNLCYKRAVNNQLVIDVLNPGLLGVFEPRMGCDTEMRNGMRVVSSSCSTCNSTTYDMNSIENGGRMPCNDGDASTGASESESAGSNLCFKAPAAEFSCKSPQATLGRSQSVFDGNDVNNLYARVPWTQAKGLPAGLDANPLFGGKSPGVSGFVSNLALSPYDIGGHFLRMVLEVDKTTHAPVLNIASMPLSSYSDPLGDAAYGLGSTAVKNLKWLQRGYVGSEVDSLRQLYPDSACQTWDCPLRRRAFYHGKDTGFRPMVPDPLRTQILYGSRAHPTMQSYSLKMSYKTGNNVPILGVYKSSNGFCACPQAFSPCSSCPLDTDALMGSWRQSSVLSATSCKQQIDWPYAGGKLRDGVSYDERFNPPSCGILDRLPAFKYRYWNSGATTPSAKTTLDAGGACHTGWPISSGPLAGCYILPDNANTFVCTGAFNVIRKERIRAKTVSELLAQATLKRMRITDCRSPPTFQMGGGTVPSEMSYGQLKRLETSRLLANDLRRKLCGNSTKCEASKNWQLPTFWQSVFSTNFPSLPSDSGENLTLWNTSWVACVQNDNNGSQVCDGIVSRADWLSPNRGAKCVDAITSSSLASSLVRDVDVCNMDSTLDRFCRLIQDARYGVYEANCLYSGVCRQKLFFYQPSTYSINNAEFVRSTVQNFYNNSVAGSCVPDFDTAAVLEANKHNLDKCAAVQLNIIVVCIQTIRVVVDKLLELTYLCLKMTMLLWELLGIAIVAPGQEQSVITQISAVLTQIFEKAIDLLKEMGNLLYKMVMNGPLGAAIEQLVKWMCEFMKWLFATIIHPLLCWIQAGLVWVLENVAMSVVNALNFIAAGRLDYLKDQIREAVDQVKRNIPCDGKDMISCNLNFDKPDMATGLLPNPTRCWAGVEPGIGSLGCSAADTCMSDSYGLVSCGACRGASSMIKFGCNTLTKLCSCNVFPVGISSCSSHEECRLDTMDCKFVDSYLQPSYGNVPCSQCSDPICLISDGTGVGQCSCLLRPLSNQRCTSVGERVSPSASELCLVATSSGLGSTGAYSANFRSLASVPCMILNQGQTYCMQVFTSASVSLPLVVGLALLRGRRLLSVGYDQPLISNVSSWEGEGEPCRSLVIADNASSLGILEQYTRGECWRWRDIGVQILADENMTDISPFFLVSWRDLLSAMLHPGSMVKIIAKAPAIVNRMLVHSEMAQPVYLAMLYYSALLPEHFWGNDTMLGQMRDYFLNNTATMASSADNRVIMGLPAVLVGSNYTKWNVTDNYSENTSSNNASSHTRSLKGIPTTLEPSMVGLWSQGPYPWPPTYRYWKSTTGKPTCAIVDTAADVFKNGLNITMMYYRQQRREPREAWVPSLPIPPLSKWDAALFLIPESVWDAGEWMWSVAKILVNETQIVDFLDAPPYGDWTKTLVRCDFVQVQTCLDRRSLFWTAVNTLVIFVIATVCARVLGVPYVEVAVILLYWPTVLYFAYGYNTLMCFPMMPTCLLSDAIGVLQYVFPERLQWPDELTTTANCTHASCMRSCVSDAAVGFSSIADHVAWTLCEIDADYCVQLGTTTTIQALRDPLVRKGMMHAVSQSMRTSQRICFAITLVYSFPMLLVVSLATSFLPVVVGIAASVAQFVFTMVVTMLIFVHSSLVARD